jgi:hypothetical protein
MCTTGGEVVGREQLPRGCGCVGEFLHYQTDPYRDRRREKFLAKRCPECGRQANQEHNRRQVRERAERIARGLTDAGGVKKGHESKYLPAGTVIQMRLGDDGTWQGQIIAGEPAVSVPADAASLLGLVQKLPRLMLRALGGRRDTEQENPEQ